MNNSNGVIIHLDDKYDDILMPSKNLFIQVRSDIEYLTCQTVEEFDKLTIEHKNNIKALIFDLNDKDSNIEKFSEKIKTGFAQYNVPIFIYSGFLEALGNYYDDHSTVFKIEKILGFGPVIEKFNLLYDSGFIDTFCHGGIIHSEIHRELNQAFIQQFNDYKQIVETISSISPSPKEAKERLQKVLKRVAIRSLLSSLLLPEENSEGNLTPEFLNPLEHYIRRLSPHKVWTGDVFTKNDSSETIFILTPRCNVASKDIDEILVCDIEVGGFPINTENSKGKDKIGYALTDKPEVSGYDRYLPPSPLFKGGKVNLSKYKMINRNDIIDNYKREITLSDELTNELLGKFGAYFFRTGISPWHKNETIAFIKSAEKDS